MKQLKENHVKMTYDIVFKKFFTDKPDLLKLILKHFLGIDSIRHLTITNPEIPELEGAKPEKEHTKHTVFRKNQENNSIEDKRQAQPPASRSTRGQSKAKLIKESLKKQEDPSFLDSSLPAETTKGKRVFLDLRVKLSTGEDINVEVQTSYKKYFLNRILFYWARLHAQSLKKGEGYENITPTYSLIFTEKPFLGRQVKSFMSSFSIKRDEEPFILFNKDLRIVIVELSKFNKSKAKLVDFKELWCYFIKESDKLTKEDREYLSRHKEMEEAMEHFDKLSQEKRLRNITLDRHIAEVIHDLDKSGWIQQGREKGIQQGREEKLQEVIWNMLQEEIEISVISKATGLSENEILKLKK